MSMLLKSYLSKKSLAYIRNNIVASYHTNVIDHFENPQNVGKLNKKDINVGTGLVGAPACGDVMQLQIKVNNYGIIEKVFFKTFGCSSAIASGSFTTELIRGMHIDKVTSIKNTDIANYLNLPPRSEYESIDDMEGGEEQRCAGNTPKSLVDEKNVHLTDKGTAVFIGLVRDKLRLKNSIINTQRLRIIELNNNKNKMKF
jgi:NifU-like protein involved in Fe-S cluster formation